MKDFILSFILPSKIVKHRDMNLFIAILLFLGCLFLSIGSSNLMGPNYIRKHPDQVLLYEELANVTDETTLVLPKLETEVVDETVYQLKEGQSFANITKTYTVGDKTLRLDIVYAPDFSAKEDNTGTIDFDLEGYYRHATTEQEIDMLFIVTKHYLFYVHNHGRYGNGTVYFEKAAEGQTVYKDNEGKVKYYLPATYEEATAVNQWGEIDKTKWSLDIDTASEDSYVEENGKYYNVFSNPDDPEKPIISYAIPHLKDNPLVTLQNGFAIDYLTVNQYEIDIITGFDGPSKDFFQNWYDFTVEVNAQAIKVMNILNGLLLIVLMPLLWILITWLMSRKYGDLTRFREYYAISAASFVLPALISFVVGFFTPYYLVASYLMFVQVAFYLFIIFRINASAAKNRVQIAPQKPNNYSRGSVPRTIETKPIKELDDMQASSSQSEFDESPQDDQE